MGLLQRFDPPAYLTDFDGVAGAREAWHAFVSGAFDESIRTQLPRVRQANGTEGTVQYYNASAFDPGGATIEQAIAWNAFPKELLRQYGRERALVHADTLWPLSRYKPQFVGKPNADTIFYRPLNEYCEWHVERDPQTNAIHKVTFTSEPPEYWQAMFGGPLAYDPDGVKTVTFPDNSDLVLRHYRELVSPDVKIEDIVAPADIDSPVGSFPKGTYFPYNKWNTTHGIVHLIAPPNSLTAEIQLGADATVLRHNARGDVLVQAEALVCCTGYGGPDRNSDPTIGATVNALARAGAMITLRNPVGLYMDHIDLTGWALPGGIDPAECVRIVRGMPRMIERLVLEVPEKYGRSVSDLTIGGEPVLYGGQIAECITVKLVGTAAQLGAVQNAPIGCDHACWAETAYFLSVGRAVESRSDGAPGTTVVFVDEGGSPGAPRSARRAPANAQQRFMKTRAL